MLAQKLGAFSLVLCTIVMQSTTNASARGGGAGFGRGLMFRGGLVRPPALIGIGRSFVTPRVLAKPVHLMPVTRFRRIFGTRLPRDGIGVYYGTGAFYDPVDFAPAVSPPVQAVADRPAIPAGEVTAGRRCASEIITVSSEAGGERPITVTRCYGG